MKFSSEAAFSAFLKTAVLVRLPRGIAFKTNDRLTGGIPDLVFIVNGRSSWFESKVRYSKGIFERLQFHTLLYIQRAWYVIWDNEDGLGFLVRPRTASGEADFGPRMPFESLVHDIVRICLEDNP